MTVTRGDCVQGASESPREMTKQTIECQVRINLEKRRKVRSELPFKGLRLLGRYGEGR